jgi:hypothetical protein
MTTSSLTIRPPQSSDELREHLDGYVEVAQSFSPDPLPKDVESLSLTPQTFVQALFGYVFVADVLQQDGQRLPGDLVTILTILFPAGQTWIPASDWF